jgi:hypothetical protein
LVIPLDSEGNQEALMSDHAVEYAQFEVAADPWEKCSQIRFARLKSPVLRHVLLCSNRSWFDFLMARTLRWLRMELATLKPSDRPEMFDKALPYRAVVLPHDFQFPDNWNFADDQIPTWSLEWEQEEHKPDEPDEPNEPNEPIKPRQMGQMGQMS